MPSSAVIRTQQQQQHPTLLNQTNHQSEKHTISMFRLLLRAFDYVYFVNTKIFLYSLFMLKRLLRFIIGLWTFIFLSLRGSKKKVSLTSSILFVHHRSVLFFQVDSISIGEIL